MFDKSGVIAIQENVVFKKGIMGKEFYVYRTKMYFNYLINVESATDYRIKSIR